MTKRKKDQSTEEIILDAARKVFVQKGMYGLPQAGLLAQKLLKKRLKNGLDWSPFWILPTQPETTVINKSSNVQSNSWKYLINMVAW